MNNTEPSWFAGLEGIFKERKGEKRALLLAKLLGTEFTIKVDALMLQKNSVRAASAAITKAPYVEHEMCIAGR